MTKKIKKLEKIKNFTVFVDTNKIRTNEKEIVLFPLKVKEWWAKLSAQCDVVMMIPEIVYLELLQQKVNYNLEEYNSSAKCINRINKKIRSKKNKIKPLSQEEVKRKIDTVMWSDLIDAKKCSLSRVPYQKITSSKLQNMVEDALWRQGVFKKNEGEGFRDAMILETVRCYCEDNAHTDVIFLSDDKILQNAASAISSHAITNLIPLTEFEAVNNYIEAGLKFNPIFLHEVIGKAVKTLRYLEKSAFGRKVIESIRHDFKLSKGEMGYEQQGIFTKIFNCEGNVVFYNLGTSFLSVVGETFFHFVTSIAITADYSQDKGLLGGGEKDNLQRTIFLEVVWEVTVTETKRFSKFKLLNRELIKDYYK
jgi:PIN domain